MSNKTFNNVKLSVAFTEAQTAANITSGENISTSFGKISKHISDFNDNVNDIVFGEDFVWISQGNESLNDYTEPGRYLIYSGVSGITDAPNILISQTGYAQLTFIVTVSRIEEDTGIITVQQKIELYDDDRALFYRRGYSVILPDFSWGGWRSYFYDYDYIPMLEIQGSSTSTSMKTNLLWGSFATYSYVGCCFYVKNNEVNSANGYTLDMEGKNLPVYIAATGQRSTTEFKIGTTGLFIYNLERVTGGCWDFVAGYNTDDMYNPNTFGLIHGTCSTAAATAAKTVTVNTYSLLDGQYVNITFTEAVPANSTLNINSAGAKSIYYRGAAITADTIQAGDSAFLQYDSTNSRYNLISIDRWGADINKFKLKVLSYGGSTWDDFLDAYSNNAVVYCRASSESNPAVGSQTRMAFLAYVNNSDPASITEAEFQYYRSINSHTDSDQGDQVYVYKINKTNGWSVTTRNAYTKVIAGSGLTSSFQTGTSANITINHASKVDADTYDTVTVNGTGHVTAGRNSRVSNVAYSTTNDPILTETIGSTTTTIETPDTVPTLDSKHLITSNAVAEPVAFLANTGHKNLLKNLHESTSMASSSVRVRLNEDGTYSLSGTASAGTSLVGTGLFSDIPTSYVGKKLRLTGGVSSSIQMRIYQDLSSTTALYRDSGSGVDFVLTQEMLTTPYDIRLYIANGTVCDGITVKPMLRLASIPDDAFKPYALLDSDIRNSIGAVANAGAKNLLKYRKSTGTVNDITFTKNSDGSYSLSGIASATTAWRSVCLLSDIPSEYVGKTLRLTGGYNYNVRLRIYSDSGDSPTMICSDEGGGVNFVLTNEMISTPAEIRISVVSGTNCSGINVYPMIRLADILGDKYEPYGKTNTELTSENSDQQTEINYAINTGVKNILKITERYKEHQGVTFTLNSDESVLISGGTTGTNSFIRLTGSQSSTDYTDQVPIPKGKYKISCPKATSNDTFVFVIGYRESSSDTRHTLQANSGNNFTNEFEITTDTGRFDATILSYSTASSYSATVYPMVRSAEITDNAFEPYALPNPELTAAEIELVDNGAKNIIPTSFSSQTTNGVSFTLNLDGTLTATRTSSSSSSAIISSADFTLEPGIYVFSCTDNPQRDTTYDSYVWDVDNSQSIARDNPNDSPGNTFTITSNTTCHVNCRVASGYNADGLIFRPMICTKAAWDVSKEYRQHIPSLSETYGLGLSIRLSDLGVDLNDYINPGIFYMQTAAGSGLCTNLPPLSTNTAFKLIVECISRTDRLKQTFIPLIASNEYYIRIYAGFGSGGANAWSSWSKVATQSNIESYSSITNNSTINIGTNTYTPIAFATCDTAADTKDKVATITGNSTWTRTIGSIVAVKFSITNTYSATSSNHITLNVNGTGAADIYYSTSAAPTGTGTSVYGYANRYIFYIWDGTYWVWLNVSYDNSPSAMTDAEYQAGTSTTSRTISPARLKNAIWYWNYNIGWTAITTNQDLDSLLTPGTYNCSTVTTAKSLLHTPFGDATTPIGATGYNSAAFKLTVECINSTATLRQVLIPLYGNTIYFIRVRQSGSWGNWYVHSGTVVT